MRTFLAFVLLCCISATAVAGDALVIRDDGYYLLLSNSTELVKVGTIVDQRTSPGDPLPPEKPEDKPTERATQIKELTHDVGTRGEAVALAAVTRSLADQGVAGRVAWDTAFRLTLNRVSGAVTQQWEGWKEKVDVLATDYSSQFFSDVASGISSSHGLDVVALQAVADGKADVELGLERDEIKLPEIIALIKMILQLLKDLGIFDGDSVGISAPVQA